ncbi:hypothetical protein ATCC90586_010502 [Pythium insidiosum]|nr:hypothetical protein ATCC90586_010502 [Pythium insidiosum]
MDTATFCRNDTSFFSGGCGSFTANATASTRWGDDTCAKGKPGWQESPLDKEVDGCKRELVTKAFDATASAWSVVFEELEIVRSGRLVVEALREAPGDSTNSSAPPVHTVVPMEKCTWSFVVNAPGYRVFYEPPARCTKAARSMGDFIVRASRKNATSSAAAVSSCVTPPPSTKNVSTPSGAERVTKAPSSSSTPVRPPSPTAVMAATTLLAVSVALSSP